jgi:hypothetical protein
MDDLNINAKLDRILELLEQIAKQTAPKTRARKLEPVLPSQDASIDEWLDWRAAEKKRGRHVTLVEIAELSGKSISTVKKSSMYRRKPKA